MGGFWRQMSQSVRGYYIGRRQAAFLYALRFLPFALFVSLALVLGFSWTIVSLLGALVLFMVLDYFVFDHLGRKVLWKMGYKNHNKPDSEPSAEQEFVSQYKQLPTADEYKKMQDKLQKRYRNNP